MKLLTSTRATDRMNFFVFELISKVSIVVLNAFESTSEHSAQKISICNVQFFELNQGQIPILTRICKSTANDAVQELDSCFKDNSGRLDMVANFACAI